jgi:hypothetical protein
MSRRRYPLFQFQVFGRDVLLHERSIFTKEHITIFAVKRDMLAAERMPKVTNSPLGRRGRPFFLSPLEITHSLGASYRSTPFYELIHKAFGGRVFWPLFQNARSRSLSRKRNAPVTESQFEFSQDSEKQRKGSAPPPPPGDSWSEPAHTLPSLARSFLGHTPGG